jgi:hypothetical protein
MKFGSGDFLPKGCEFNSHPFGRKSPGKGSLNFLFR